MTGYTAVLIEAPIGLGSCERFSDMLHMPVRAYYTVTRDRLGEGCVGAGGEAEELGSLAVSNLRDLVAMSEKREFHGEVEMWEWARKRLAAIKAALAEAESALARDYDCFTEAAERLRIDTDDMAMTLRAYESGLPVEDGR